MDKRTLLTHVTDGGAVYVSDNHDFRRASIVIRIDARIGNAKPEDIAVEITKRWNAYPEAELRIRELVNACEELLRNANGMRGEWSDPLGTAEETMNEARLFLSTLNT